MTDHPHVLDDSQRTAAKIAGFAYLIPVAFVVTANFGLRGGLFVSGDMAETVRRLAASQTLFRLSLGFDLVYCLGVVVLLTALFVVLAPVNRYLTLLATVWKLVYAVSAMMMVLSFLSVATLVTTPFYAALAPEQLQALVKLNTNATWNEYYVGLVFWSMSATIIGWLWLKSRYIPRGLAMVGFVSAAWCAFCAIAYIINPGFTRFVNLWVFDTPLALFDIALSFWLIFKGLRPARVATG